MKSLIKITSILLFMVALTATSCKKATKQPLGLGNEVDFSSPVLALGESWQGTMGGLVEVTGSYDTATNTVYSTVKNISSQTLCWGLVEPHMQLVNQTVGELGPLQLGNIAPGQQVSTSVIVANDPKYSNYTFDGYVIHVEVYDCTGGTPLPYPGGI